MKIFRFILFGFLLTFVTSCHLDDLPTDTIAPSNAFRNLNDVQMGLIGAYAALDDDIIVPPTIVADEVKMPQENTVSNNTLYRWIYDSGSGSVTSAFYMLYQVVDRVNRVLENIDKIQINASDIPTREQYRGELLALRAYAQFELLRNYASGFTPDAMGVPYMMKSEVGSPGRDSFKANMTSVEADLSAAKALIPASFKDVTRITKVAVSAIQARVALYNQEWQNAVTFAGEVISQKPLASRSDFPLIWTDNSNAEVVWKLTRVVGDSPTGASFFRQTGGIALYVPSTKWLAQIDPANDIRFQAYVTYDPNRNAVDARKSAYLIRKYDGGNPSNPGLSDLKLFRTGEMYLIRAEAYAELNDLPNANLDLNKLRSARINFYATQNYPDKPQMIAAIYNEKYIELAFEGQRFFDLKRRGLNITRLPQDLINNVDKNSLTPNDAQYAFPIPADEMAVNPNMVQNPKY